MYQTIVSGKYCIIISSIRVVSVQKIRDFLQIIDILLRWLYNSVRYYYITAGVTLFFRLIVFGAERNYGWDIFFMMLIGIRVCYVFRKRLIKLLIPSHFR